MRNNYSHKFKYEINVVPYIDVMLILLIIFMITTSTTTQNFINLPNAINANLEPNKYIKIILKKNLCSIINIYSTKDHYNLQTAINRNDLILKLQTLHVKLPNLPVMIAADKEIKYDEVIQLLAEIKKLGIIQIGLVTK